MRGKFLHNKLLVEPVAAEFERLGATVRREYFVREARGYVDFLITGGAVRIVGEAEQRIDRVERDITKAIALKADILLIVVPTQRIARAVTRCLTRLARLPGGGNPAIIVLPLGTLLQRLRNISAFKDKLKVLETLSPNISRKGRESKYL